MIGKSRFFRNAIIGILMSFMLAWMTSYLFVDSLLTYEYDEKLGFQVLKRGIVHYHRSEGWAETKIGEHGIIGGGKTFNENVACIAILGNSYVEAFQINDNCKIGAVVNRFLEQNDMANYFAVQIGMSGNSLSDYCYKIPRYKRIIPNVVNHYIILGSVSEVSQSGAYCHVSGSENLALVETQFKPEWQEFKKWLAKLRLDFAWDVLKEDIIGARFDFAPSFLKKENEQKDSAPEEKSKMRLEVSGFLLDEIKARAAGPVAIVLCPTVPSIAEGEVRCEDPDSEDADKLMRQCEQRGIEFINLKNEFCEFYRKKGSFVRGFFNSKPASGHLNADGARIVGMAIAESFISRGATQCCSIK